MVSYWFYRERDVFRDSEWKEGEGGGVKVTALSLPERGESRNAFRVSPSE